jgi:hypothetical protein
MASIAFGIHGIQHSIEEIHYNFNPLEGNWGTYSYNEDEDEDYD